MLSPPLTGNYDSTIYGAAAQHIMQHCGLSVYMQAAHVLDGIPAWFRSCTPLILCMCDDPE